jgi:hypothetical protein
MKPIGCILTALVLGALAAAPAWAAATADRAVTIATQSRDRVESSGAMLKDASRTLFEDFAARTAALQNLIDTRKALESSGLLDKGDPDGEARKAHINASILVEVGALKDVCDENLDELLSALDSYDKSVAQSVIDSQSTRSINSNYELKIGQYLKAEQIRFEQAEDRARKLLEEYRLATDEQARQRILNHYKRAKVHVDRIGQRRTLYETRAKVARVNQQLTARVRDELRNKGNDIARDFRNMLAQLYGTFSRVTPVVETGDVGTGAALAGLGFSNLSEIEQTLSVVNDSIAKLSHLLDDMATEVVGSLGEVSFIDAPEVTTDTFSVEEEMEYLRRQRQAWQKIKEVQS